MSLRATIAFLAAGFSLTAAPDDLVDAAQRGNWAQVRSMIASGGGVRTAQPDGMTALHWAVQANEETMVTALLKAGADANAANRYGITPLWLAATNGSAPITRLLLAAKANASIALPHGETALMAAARTGEPETIRLLIQAGANPNASETSQGETALMWAAAENHPEAIRELIRGGAAPNAHSKALEMPPMDWLQIGMVNTVMVRGGFTALMHAARQNAQESVKALADSGANLNERDPDGTTALEFAIINQHYDLAALLLEKGADPNVADSTGMNAVYAAVDMRGFRGEVGRPGQPQMDKLDALGIVKLALAHGGDANARLGKPVLARHHGFGDASLGKGATALMRASKTADIEAMQVLLDAGAKADDTLANGTTVGMVVVGACGPQAIPALQLLAKHGANVNAASPKGDTALHAAARAGANAMVRALADLGANLDAKDSNGKTALDVVSQPGRTRHEDTEALLKELAAKRAAK